MSDIPLSVRTWLAIRGRQVRIVSEGRHGVRVLLTIGDATYYRFADPLHLMETIQDMVRVAQEIGTG